VPKTQPVSGPITVNKEAIGWVCDARDDANGTPSVGYKRARSISSVGSGQRILRVGNQWRGFQRRNIGLSWQQLGLHQCSSSGSLTSSAGSCVGLYGVTRKCHLSWDPSRPATNRPALPLRQAEAVGGGLLTASGLDSKDRCKRSKRHSERQKPLRAPRRPRRAPVARRGRSIWLIEALRCPTADGCNLISPTKRRGRSSGS
jgi:hypothetical protein